MSTSDEKQTTGSSDDMPSKRVCELQLVAYPGPSRLRRVVRRLFKRDLPRRSWGIEQVGQLNITLRDNDARADVFWDRCKGGKYVGTEFNLIIPGFFAQGGSRGDTRLNDGHSKEPPSPEETKVHNFGSKGVVGAATHWYRGGHGQEFFVTLAPRSDLNGHHYVLGHVDKRNDVTLDLLEKYGQETGRPLKTVYIKDTKCWEWDPEKQSYGEIPKEIEYSWWQKALYGLLFGIAFIVVCGTCCCCCGCCGRLNREPEE